MRSRTKKDKSLAKSKFYQRQYAEIPPMSSTELLSLQQQQQQQQDQLNKEKNLIIIDVRTKAERSISMIPGSIPLSTFQSNVIQSLSDDDDELQIPANANIVFYCTIGYRSGMEARRYHQLYPSLRGRIYNLDGIVSYTHASSSDSSSSETTNDPKDTINSSASESPLPPPKLINPNTNETTNLVHTFGPNWDCVNDAFETIHFSPPMLLWRMGQVGLVSTLRMGQGVVYHGRKKCGACCACCFGRRKKTRRRRRMEGGDDDDDDVMNDSEIETEETELMKV